MRNTSLLACATTGIVLIGLLVLLALAYSGPTLSYFGAVDPSRVESEVNYTRGRIVEVMIAGGKYDEAEAEKMATALKP